jgi:toxin ParE1/3/4
MGKYILDPRVEDELWAIWKYIADDNADGATQVVEAACETFKILAQNPQLGRTRSFRNSRLQSIRFLPVSGFENYLIFYRVDAGGIQVNHVYHGARNIEALFAEKPNQEVNRHAITGHCGIVQFQTRTGITAPLFGAGVSLWVN